MSEVDIYFIFQEITTGVITLLLAVLAVGLGNYIFTHRLVLTIEDRDARNAAIGLFLFFAMVQLRGSLLWYTFIAERKGWAIFDFFISPFLHLGLMAGAVLGALLTVRAFHTWPWWFIFITLSTIVPIVVFTLL